MRPQFLALAISLSAVGVWLTGPALAQVRQGESGQATSKVQVDKVYRSSKLIGMSVKNDAGKDLGKIDDVVTSKAGKVRYAALSFGGFAGFGSKLFAVPWDALKLKVTDNDRHFVLNIDEQRLKNAPGFERDRWPNFGDAQFTEQIDKFYQSDRPKTAASPSAPATATAADSPREPGLRISKLAGMNVRNPASKDLGSIKEVVINVDRGQIAYAALSFGGVLGIGDKLFAVPWRSLDFKGDKDEHYFVLDVSPERLKTAPGFDESNWPDVADPNWSAGIDKYYGSAEESTRPAQKPLK